GRGRVGVLAVGGAGRGGGRGVAQAIGGVRRRLVGRADLGRVDGEPDGAGGGPRRGLARPARPGRAPQWRGPGGRAGARQRAGSAHGRLGGCRGWSWPTRSRSTHTSGSSSRTTSAPSWSGGLTTCSPRSTGTPSITGTPGRRTNRYIGTGTRSRGPDGSGR